MAQFMLYKQGSMITCGSLSLDYIIVEEEDVKATQEKGWVLDPNDTILPEPEPEPEPAKKTRKTKAADDEQNEG